MPIHTKVTVGNLHESTDMTDNRREMDVGELLAMAITFIETVTIMLIVQLLQYSRI